jgi:ferredoxin
VAGPDRVGRSPVPALRRKRPCGIRDVALDIRIDRSLCMGSGNCSFWASGTFDQDDEGLAVVVDPTGDPEDRVRSAVEGCPTGALSIAGEG